ncbi:alpha-2-macroglobulin-like isoform X2 [Ambystoma mexicanum]
MEVNYKMVPTWKIIVSLLLHTGELVSDYKQISVKPCFQNTVDVRLSAQKVLPGSSVTLTIQTAPNSACGVTAVDQSIEILTGGSQQSLGDQVVNQMPYTYLYALYIDGFSLGDSPTGCTNMRDKLIDGTLYAAVADGDTGASVAADLEANSLVTIYSTDNRKQQACPKPNYCPEPTPTPFYPGMGGGPFTTSAGPSLEMARADAGAATAVMETLRDTFPEIWIDDNVRANSNGEATITTNASDTITTWNVYVFCNSDSKGFGVLRIPAKLEVFLNFFTEPTLPECAVRKESFMLTGTSYMYKEKCSEVDMWLHNSTHFTASLMGVENGGCICENERTTRRWNFTAIKAGHINVTMTALAKPGSNCDGESDNTQYMDTVIRPLLIVTEGITQEETENFVICPKGGSVIQPLNMTLPGNVVEDSAKIVVTCVPDPAGICMQNLENLVQMPTGCVQENLASLKIVAMFHAYKTDTGTLTTEDDIKMRVWMTNLWANLMRFYSWKGCFTTWSSYYPFSDSGTGCNFWFTTEAMSCLYQIKNLIYFDDTVIAQMKSWIASQQNLTTGAFPVSGPGADPHLESDVAGTAQVVIVFFKAGEDASDPVVNLALGFLASVAPSLEEPFEMAMACVALATAGDVKSAKPLQEKLMGRTLQSGGWRFLTGGAPDPTGPSFFWTRVSSSIIILNSLLARSCLLLGVDIAEVAPIMSFISGQMGSNGQFGFAVVTAMAQEALLMYGKLTYAQDGSNQVVITSSGDTVDRNSVDQSNRLLVREVEVPVAPGSAQIEVSGSGCLFIQSTRKYNVKIENKENQFSLTVVTTPGTCDNGSPRSVVLNITVRYTKSNASNLVIMDIKIPTGFKLDTSQLDQMTQQATIQQYYLHPVGHCRMYINSIPSEPITFTLTLVRTMLGQNLSPCYALVYDVYNADASAMKEYTAACSQPQSTA